jgi:IS5 family transposase
MRSTRKGNQWYFGMKAHIGVDSKTKLIHSVVATSANVHDSVVVKDLLHGDETRIWGDSAYTGKKDSMTEVAPMARDFTNRKGYKNHPLSEEEKRKNRNKSKVRAKVEHPFCVMKRRFGFVKVRYRGLTKNAHHLFVSCALVNLVMAGKTLLKKAMKRDLQASCA